MNIRESLQPRDFIVIVVYVVALLGIATASVWLCPRDRATAASSTWMRCRSI